MGNDNWLLGMFCFDDVPETLVEDVVETLRENGFTADIDLEEAAADSHGPPAPQNGSFDAWYEGTDGSPGSRPSYTFEFHPKDPTDGMAPFFFRESVTWLDHTERDYDVHPDVEALVDAFAALAEVFDPWVAFLAVMPNGAKYPDGGRPPDHGMTTVPFAVVFGPDWFDHLGGREHVLDAPVYETRPLDTGSVLVRTRDRPVVKHPYDEGPAGSPEKHLFEGASAEARQRFVDPFRGLEEGELATDPVMCEAHAPFEWGGMDYAAFPEQPDRSDHCHVLCVRREADKLWEAHNDEFVRRLVDEDGLPIGDLPESVPPDQEFISGAIRTAYEDDPPMHMYRMESLEEPSLYAQLRGMDAIPEGESIWQDRETPATR